MGDCCTGSVWFALADSPNSDNSNYAWNVNNDGNLNNNNVNNSNNAVRPDLIPLAKLIQFVRLESGDVGNQRSNLPG